MTRRLIAIRWSFFGAAALLVLFLLMGIVIFALFEKVNQPVTALLEQAARTALSPEPEAAAREETAEE